MKLFFYINRNLLKYRFALIITNSIIIRKSILFLIRLLRKKQLKKLVYKR